MRNIWDVLPEDAMPIVLVLAICLLAIRKLPDGQREGSYDAIVDGLFTEEETEAARRGKGRTPDEQAAQAAQAAHAGAGARQQTAGAAHARR